MNASVRSADRTLAIFETFALLGRQLQLRELAELCEMPASTCHGLVQTLLNRGYLYTLGQRKELYPSRRLLTLGRAIEAGDPFLSRVAGVLEALRDDCGETVTVGKRQADRVLYLYALDGPRAIRYAAQAGDLRALHSTALGKALLSSIDSSSLRQWLKGRELQAVTSRTITSPARLMREIAQGRERGFFVARGEQAEDLTAVAVPVLRHDEVLGLSLAGPASRIDPLAERLGAHLLRVKRELELRLAA
jgi:DNA-binding IclR family transcriptional regulator